MRRRLSARLLMVCAVAAGACSGANDHSTNSVTATAAVTAAEARDAQTAAVGMEHGDHNPHHGGVVYMYDDMHYEVVLDPNGHHRVYFTDSARQDLPASVASSVTLTVERPQAAPETLNGAIDPQGESWLMEGAAVRQTGTSVRVTFVAHGGQYWIDVPFIPQAE